MRSIEELARAAGLLPPKLRNPNPAAHASQESVEERLVRFAALVRAQALEEAAVIVEKVPLETFLSPSYINQLQSNRAGMAAAIRAAQGATK